jgi:hypothetical protein
MRKRTILTVISTVVLSVRISSAQIHLCCTAEDCNRRQVQPNLQLSETTHLFGSLVDVTGVLFKKSKVELRKWVSPTQQIMVKIVTTDQTGHFDLGQVEKGEYRFLPSPDGGFKQPDRVACPQTECNLELTLRPSTTDIPESLCPIK